MMRSLTITYRITTKQITNFVRTEKDGRVRQRLIAMKFISLGQTIPQAAKRLKRWKDITRTRKSPLRNLVT